MKKLLKLHQSHKIHNLETKHDSAADWEGRVVDKIERQKYAKFGKVRLKVSNRFKMQM